MGETMSRAVIEALKAELAQAKAALSEANTALSLVSGALADADCVVGPAVEFGDQVRRLAADLAQAREALEAENLGAKAEQKRLADEMDRARKERDAWEMTARIASDAAVSLKPRADARDEAVKGQQEEERLHGITIDQRDR